MGGCPQPQQGTDPLDPQGWGNRGTEGGRALCPLVPCSGMGPAQLGVPRAGGISVGPGLGAEGALGGGPQLCVGKVGGLCVTRAVRPQLGVSPREPVLEAGTWGERWLWGRVQPSHGQEAALAASRAGIHWSGWDEGPRQWDGEAMAVLALRELHHGGFTIDSCCTGTAPVGTAR